MFPFDDPTLLTCVAAVGVYLSNRKWRTRRFDVYERTAELEHEFDISHIDERVQNACKICVETPVATPSVGEDPKLMEGRATMLDAIIQLPVLTPNEAREIRQGWFNEYGEVRSRSCTCDNCVHPVGGYECADKKDAYGKAMATFREYSNPIPDLDILDEEHLR